MLLSGKHLINFLANRITNDEECRLKLGEKKESHNFMNVNF